MDKKHILVLASFAPSIINFRKELIESFIQKGHMVSVIVPNADEATKAKIVGLGCHFFSISMGKRFNPFQDLAYLFRLWLMMLKIKPDHLISYTIKPVIWGSIAGRLAGVKQIYAIITGLGYAFIDVSGFKKIWINYIVKKLYKVALYCNRTVFFQNPDDRALFEGLKLSESSKNVVVNGSGVNLSWFQESQLEVNKMHFLVLARLLKDKGIYEFIEAVRSLKHKYLKVVFSVGGYLDHNPAAIKQHELQSWVDEGLIQYLGKLDDVRAAIGDCTVYVLPSYREGTPRTVLEAMAMGRPIITTDVPGCRETVVPQYNGFLVPEKSALELAKAMEYFICNPNEILTMGANSRKLAEEKYDVHHVNHSILKEMELE